MTKIKRHRTALKRNTLSRPVRLAVEEGLINRDTTFFDYGCGRGDDVRLLTISGTESCGWDPVHHPVQRLSAADVVNLGYVINVIEDPAERVRAIQEAWSLAKKVLIVAARLSVEANRAQQNKYEDGYLTRTGTFQKFFEQDELHDWINHSINVQSIPAAPGIFYVLRDESLRQELVASRYRRRTPVPRQKVSHLTYEKHRPAFDSLLTFVSTRGRLPEENEISTSGELRLIAGSLARAFNIVKEVTGAEQWERIREERAQDLLIYLALARFGGRPRFSELPTDLQLDVKAFYVTYKRACEVADELLFSVGNMKFVDESCRKSGVGKLTQNALYLHVSALPHLSPILRVYEGCARAYIGAVEGANLIKLNRHAPQVSYLQYPEFEKNPHPALAASLLVPLKTFHIQYREYRDSDNPPILHRKETFLPPEHPLKEKFARLTRKEEELGLYERPELIGTLRGWTNVLAERRLRLSGHNIVPAPDMDI